MEHVGLFLELVDAHLDHVADADEPGELPVGDHRDVPVRRWVISKASLSTLSRREQVWT
jgi:hypothetical protein